MNHALTYFNNVRLPPTALLGSLEKPTSLYASLMQAISRVAVGTIALGCLSIPFMQCYATIGTMYSLRRTVGSPDNRQPILQFRTQQLPILTATAQTFVMSAFAQWATKAFCDSNIEWRVRHGIAAVLKAIGVQHSQAACLAVSERCGAQGLFAHNQMTVLHVSSSVTVDVLTPISLTL